MLRRQKSPSQRQARRRFLATGAGSVAILAFPMISKGQGPIAMRWQSAWSSKDIFHEYALDWAKRIPMPSGTVEVRPVMDYEAAGSSSHGNQPEAEGARQ